MRALVGARVSVVTGPQKVSHLAQIETCARWAAEHGHTVVGTFQDLDVSATVPPFERPDLGQWLAPEMCGEWDILVFSKIDRVFRSTRDCIKMAEWCEQNSKILVFAEDGMKLDYRAIGDSFERMMAEFFIYIGAFFAQIELSRFRTRSRDAHRYIRSTDRWSTGAPPFGFRIVDHPSGRGKTIERNPEQYRILRQMADMLVTDGMSINQIKDCMNADHPRSQAWTVSGIIQILTSARTQGIKMHKKQPVLDANGDPVRIAEPTFTHDEWQQIQAAVESRRRSGRMRQRTTSPILGVGFCGKCGSRMTHQTKHKDGKQYRYYRCSSNGTRPCPGVMIRADDVDTLLEEQFLELRGDDHVIEKVFVPGEDRSHELDQVRDTIDRLRKESDMGLIVGPADEAEYLSRLKSLVERRTVLESSPVLAPRWETLVSDQTYKDVWATSTTEERRRMLIDAGVRFTLWSKHEWALQVPEQ